MMEVTRNINDDPETNAAIQEILEQNAAVIQYLKPEGSTNREVTEYLELIIIRAYNAGRQREKGENND